MTPDFTLKAGDPRTINGVYNGGLTDITGWVFTMAARRAASTNSPVLWTLTAIIDNAAAGTFHFTLSGTDTDQAEDLYYYDIKVVDDSSVQRHTTRSVFKIAETIT